jgi:hypothetical protein
MGASLHEFGVDREELSNKRAVEVVALAAAHDGHAAAREICNARHAAQIIGSKLFLDEPPQTAVAHDAVFCLYGASQQENMERAVLDLRVEQRVDTRSRYGHDFHRISGSRTPHERLHSLHYEHPSIPALHRFLHLSAPQALEDGNKLVGESAHVVSLQHVGTAQPVLQRIGEGYLRDGECPVDGVCFVVPIQRSEGLSVTKTNRRNRW